MVLVYSFAYGLMSFIGQFPLAFKFVHFLRGQEYFSRIARPDTDIVIEGFPRSANTFSVVAFRFFRDNSGDDLEIAHHLHAPAQILLAQRYRVPCIVLIRKPIDAVASLMPGKPLLSGKQAFQCYYRFYSRLLDCRGTYLVALFEDVTEDFGETIDKLNAHYGTNFSGFCHSDENVKKCFERIKFINDEKKAGDVNQLARPDLQRNEIKNELYNQLLSSHLKQYRERAESIYMKFIRRAE